MISFIRRPLHWYSERRTNSQTILLVTTFRNSRMLQDQPYTLIIRSVSLPTWRMFLPQPSRRDWDRQRTDCPRSTSQIETRNQSIRSVNCGAIPESLVASELFVHKEAHSLESCNGELDGLRRLTPVSKPGPAKRVCLIQFS
jgi:hypothetical protein